MRATKYSICICVLASLLSLPSFARDEAWGIFQFRRRLDGDHQILAEYVRRDRGNLFEKKFLNLYRLSWAGKLGNWSYLVGGASVHFANSSDERRLHQFAIYSFNADNKISGLIRIGLEQRRFISDEYLYLRSRSRVQFNLFPMAEFGLSVYDELFYVPDGHAKFYSGFNENRLGLGIRYAVGNFETTLYQTTGFVRSLKSEDRFEWIQIQTVLSF